MSQSERTGDVSPENIEPLPRNACRKLPFPATEQAMEAIFSAIESKQILPRPTFPEIWDTGTLDCASAATIWSACNPKGFEKVLGFSKGFRAKYCVSPQMAQLVAVLVYSQEGLPDNSTYVSLVEGGGVRGAVELADRYRITLQRAMADLKNRMDARRYSKDPIVAKPGKENTMAARQRILDGMEPG